MNYPTVKTIKGSFFTFPTIEMSKNQSYAVHLQLTSVTRHSGELECLSSLCLNCATQGMLLLLG